MSRRGWRIRWILPALVVAAAAGLRAEEFAALPLQQELEQALASNEDEPAPLPNDVELTSLEDVGDDEFPAASSDRLRSRDIVPLFDGDAGLDGIAPVSEEHAAAGLLLFVDYDAFRGLPDGGWQNNGLRTGFNLATRLGGLSEATGIGLQVGASLGIYDWAGTDYRMQHQEKVQSQGFLTYGFFRKPDENSAIVAGIVQDWMFNETFGVFGQNPTLSQLRGQLGYAASASNEYGIWGTVHVVNNTKTIPNFGPTLYESVDQLSGYWHHKWFAGGPDTWISVGVPAHSRLTGQGSLGDYVVSATALCPFSDAVSSFSSVTYMHQSGGLGARSATDDAWNFVVGISIYPGRNARATNIAGHRWMPLLPVANNGSFLVDTNNWY